MLMTLKMMILLKSIWMNLRMMNFVRPRLRNLNCLMRNSWPVRRNFSNSRNLKELMTCFW
jgi:hypothetical protein